METFSPKYVWRDGAGKAGAEKRQGSPPPVRFINLRASRFPAGTWAAERPSLSGSVARLPYFSRGGAINQIAP